MQPFESEALEAIDATLAGEAVDPQYAELAELALLLAESRPAVDPEWAQSLDERVAQELGAERPGRRLWIWAPAIGLAAAAVVAIVVGLSSSGGPRPVVSTSAVGRAAAAPSVAGPSV